MSERQGKAESTPRKRALVSCDRCKLRRARCIRDNPTEPCADCKLSGVECESKLPRKQRVYGSVETLSLRFRALEALVKGLFPTEDLRDTTTLFKIAAARKIAMPAYDDVTPRPTEIFDDKHLQGQDYGLAPSGPSLQTTRSGTFTHLPTPSINRYHNPFVDPPPPQPVERLIPTLHGVPHYFGASSSFKLAIKIRDLVSRCKVIPEAKLLQRQSSSLQEDVVSDGNSKTTEPSRSTQTIEQIVEPDPDNDDSHSRKRSRADFEAVGDSYGDGNYDNDTIADFLPSRSVADAMISAYFEQPHLVIPVFHRSIFQYRYEATWQQTQADRLDPLRENEETAWLCCLALIFAFGAQALEKHDPTTARVLQKKYLGFVRTYFRSLITTASLTNVQALVLLQPARMAISMGMHREGTNAEFDPIERNTRRLVWWSLYSFEKLLCIMLGRPSCIEDVEVSTKTPDDSTEFPSGVFDRGLEITKLGYQIRRKAYFASNSPEHCKPTPLVAQMLLSELDDWKASLPAHFQLDASVPPRQKRSIFLLHTFYYYMRTLVTRSFLIEKVEDNICRLEHRPPPPGKLDEVRSLSEDCIASAHRSLQCLNKSAEMGHLNGVSWLDVFYVFHGVLIVCADFLARPKEQVESPEDTERKASVRSILQSTQVTKLAPTYNILSQIAVQFATITGAIKEHSFGNSVVELRNVIPPIPQPMQPTPFAEAGSVIENSGASTEWHENVSANVPWDFFDISLPNSSVAMANYPAYSGAFVEAVEGVSEVDGWTAKSLRGTRPM
ncbi:hypothetical protein EJ04DRAFT_587032 [Polyplosphaeria fusca]|uniref:Zn(2)-C6 fungal-type domain-containing protein n=1 Tax=Polyplosphaeria fusca TaxID=682080 RepID=A0A9P4V6D9_9PLEO|nr:hypothetical protein EJ04DRAFT_587032 [Polyplosphaeria fusca]